MYNEKGLAQSAKWPAGMLCITIAANIADSGILSFDACFPDSVVGFVPAQGFQGAEYFEYFMRTVKADLLAFAPATAQKNMASEAFPAGVLRLRKPGQNGRSEALYRVPPARRRPKSGNPHPEPPPFVDPSAPARYAPH